VTPTQIETIVLDAFAYLVDSFGFHYVSTDIHAPECWSTFRNATTAVTVHFELGSSAWVELAELRRQGDNIVERNRSALEFLVKERAPREAALRSNDSDEDVKRLIYEKARQLREYGSDVLRGDFHVFPRLRELAAEGLKRRNATER
jgi:hypothetical protein